MPGEGGQQRRVDVDDALGEAAEEAGAQELHVAGEHDELDALLGEPAGHRAVARRAVGERSAARRTTRRLDARAPARPLAAPARPACRSRPRRPRRPRGRARGRGSPAGSCPPPRRGRRPSRDFELREPPAGRAQRARLQQRVDALEHRVGASGGRTCRSPAARRRRTSAITFERPPRRTSTARVRPTLGLRGRDDVEDRVVEPLQSTRPRALGELRRAVAARARRAPAAARAASDGIADVAARALGLRLATGRRSGAGCRAAGTASPRPTPTPSGTGASAPSSPRAPTCGRPRARARPTRRSTRPVTRSGGDGDGWITPARARWPTIARTASSSAPPATARSSCSPTAKRPSTARPSSRLATVAIARLVDRRALDEEDVQALVARRGEQQAARGLAVAPGAAGLLVVGLDRARDALVADRPHVGLVDAHAERVGRHDDRRLAGHEAPLRLRAHARARGPRGRPRRARPSSRAQPRGELVALVARAGVDDRRQRASARRARRRSRGARPPWSRTGRPRTTGSGGRTRSPPAPGRAARAA